MSDDPVSATDGNISRDRPLAVKPDSDGAGGVAASLVDRADASSEAGKTSAGTRPRGGEFYRKLLHMSPGLLPFILVWIPHPARLDLKAQVIVTGLCVLLTVVFLSLHRVVRRLGEENLLSTALSYPAIVMAAVWLFPEHAELTGVVVVVLAFGDGAAYIGGKLFGRRALPWNPRKTWMGTTCFVLAAAPTAALAYWLLADPPQSFTVALISTTVTAIVAAIAESLPVRLTDNLRVGVSALAASALMEYALADLDFF